MCRAAIVRGIGFRRGGSKVIVLKLILASIPYIPVVVTLVTLANLSSAPTPSYASLYDGLALVYVLFAALIGPDLLCPDRRERVLTLYFAAPISRGLYIGAQCLGLGLLLMMLTLVPMVILLFGQAVLSDSAVGYIGNHAADLWTSSRRR